MSIKFKIIFIVILNLILFILPSFYKIQSIYFFDNHPELKPTESLKKNFTVGLAICKNKNFYTPFEIEYCSWKYVKEVSLTDYKILENIRYYCLNSTKCEYDRRECIDKILK